MLKQLIIIFLSPLILFANINEVYSTLFAQKLSDHDIEGCHHILDEWESYDPHASPIIHGLRATVVLVEGDLIKSKLMMEEALASLKGTTLSSESADTIRGFYTQALHFASYDEDLELVSSLGGSSPMIMLCRGKQPNRDRGIADRRLTSLWSS